MSHVRDAVPSLDVFASEIDAQIQLPGMGRHTGGRAEGSNQLVAAHAGLASQRIQGGARGRRVAQAIQGRAELLGLREQHCIELAEACVQRRLSHTSPRRRGGLRVSVRSIAGTSQETAA